MRTNAVLELRMNPEARGEIDDAIFAGVQESFELDIKPEAVRSSPVRTGTNRRSIDTETVKSPTGQVQAQIFTQSGYGGYLEIGTRKMSAQPYLFPAFEKFKNAIAATIGKKIGAISILRRT